MVERSQIEAAVAILRAGGLVALPTETVYGLAADPRSPAAIARLFTAKGRPAGRPLPVLLPGARWLPGWAPRAGAGAHALATRFWPGPLTLVLEAAEGLPPILTGGMTTVGLRVPSHPLALALLGAWGDGLATPSANPHGAVSPTTADEVARQLGGAVDLVLDGGPCEVGVESTVVDLSAAEAPRLLRSGALSVGALEEALGRPLERAGGPSTRFVLRTEVAVARADGLDACVAAARARGQRVAVVDQGRREGAAGLYRAIADADLSGADLLVIEIPAEPAFAAALLERLGRVPER